MCYNVLLKFTIFYKTKKSERKDFNSYEQLKSKQINVCLLTCSYIKMNEVLFFLF